MTLRCPSCSANLKVNIDRLGGRPSAKCPSCHASVPLNNQATTPSSEQRNASGAAAQATIVVTCTSCRTRLRAPISRAGSKSTCPKCQSSVLIETSPAASKPGMMASATGSDAQDESSSASTRRIDSRMLGVMRSSAPVSGSAGIDLDAFLKTGSTAGSSAAPAETPVSLPKTDPGSVAPLLKPPVEALEKIAKEIRQTAEHLTQAPEPAAAATMGMPQHAQQAAVTPAPARAPRRPLREVVDHSEGPASAETSHGGDGYFPAWRGILAGSMAGMVIGGAQAAVSMSPFAMLLPPLPFPMLLVVVPETILRLVFLGMLGMLAGFIAGAIGSPRISDHPLNVMRCVGTSLLVGLACGLVGGLITGTGVQVWPIANWMRDLLLVGLISPAVHRLLPAPRS